MFLIRHIYVSYPTYFLNDMFYSTTYYTKQHIFFNNIYMFFNNIWMFLNNIIMSYNIIGHMYVMHRFKTYMWSLCNIFLHLSTAITPFVALVVQWTCQFIVSSIFLNCSRFCSSSEMMFSTSYVHVPEGCCSAQHSEATPTSRVIHMFVCVCVYVVHGITTPCLKKRLHSALPRLVINLNRRTPTQGLLAWAAS